ncbi:MAG: ATP-grasp domain-containing protein [Clostridia bacterium]|nr:ATP-grasp domain-containing protein [Clostridia bacterium]
MSNAALKGKRLAVFGASNVVLEVTRFACENDIVLISVGNDPQSPMHRVSQEQYYIDCLDETAVKQLFAEKHIDGLLSCSGESVIRQSVGFIERMGIRYFATAHQWDILMNKKKFKEYASRFGIKKIPDYDPMSADIDFPVIVKPVDNGGSFGISVCNNRQELDNAVEYAKENSLSGNVICERFIDGDYFQFEIWRQDGKSYFPYTKERLFYAAVGDSPQQPFADIYPSTSDDLIARELYGPMSEIFDSLGVDNGSCMFQGLIWNGYPYIMDTAFRLSGGMDFRVVEKDKGVDLVGSHMEYALTGKFGGDFSALSRPLNMSYATLCVGLKNGIIGKIIGLDKVSQKPYVYSLFTYYAEGDEMKYSGLFLQVLSRIFIRGKDIYEVKRHMAEIIQMIEVYDENGEPMLRDYPEFL